MRTAYVRARTRRIRKLRKRREISQRIPQERSKSGSARLFRWIEALLLTAVLLLFLVFAGMYLFHIEPRIVLSGSMEPSIHTGSVCLLDTNAPMDEISAGDVVAFRIDDKTMVIHRAVRITEEGIETKGDANDVSDGISATKDTYAGKVLLAVPVLGYLFMGIRKFRWFVGTGILLLWLLAGELGRQ